MSKTQQNTQGIEFHLFINPGDARLLRGVSDDIDILFQRKYAPTIGFVYIDGIDAMHNDSNPTYQVSCYKSGYDWATDAFKDKILDTFSVTRKDLRG